MKNLHEREIITMEKFFPLYTRRAIIRYASEILFEEAYHLCCISLSLTVNSICRFSIGICPDEGLTINLLGNLGKY